MKYVVFIYSTVLKAFHFTATNAFTADLLQFLVNSLALTFNTGHTKPNLKHLENTYKTTVISLWRNRLSDGQNIKISLPGEHKLDLLFYLLTYYRNFKIHILLDTRLVADMCLHVSCHALVIGNSSFTLNYSQYHWIIRLREIERTMKKPCLKLQFERLVSPTWIRSV